MNHGTYQYSSAVPDDEFDEQDMPAQLSFDWNPSAVTSFLQKLNTVNKEGIDFPPMFRHISPITASNKDLSVSATENRFTHH